MIQKTPSIIEEYKPLEQWTPTDYVKNACIYCKNNEGYKGPPITTPDEYDRHIIKKHAGSPGYPGPADIEKYGLKLNGNGNGNDKKISKVAEAAKANLSGGGIMPENSQDKHDNV